MLFDFLIALLNWANPESVSKSKIYCNWFVYSYVRQRTWKITFAVMFCWWILFFVLLTITNCLQPLWLREFQGNLMIWIHLRKTINTKVLNLAKNLMSIISNNNRSNSFLKFSKFEGTRSRCLIHKFFLKWKLL